MSSYDPFARAYAKHTATNTYNTHYERPAVHAAMEEIRGKRVLDAGCASGEHTALLLERGARVVAIDSSPAFITIVRERFGDRVHAEQADLRGPLAFFRDDSFDIVLSSLTLHYLEDWSVALAEFRRLLVPGGRLVISTHHPALTTPMVANYFETQLVTDVWRIGEADTEVQFYHRPMEAIVAPIIDAGFAVDGLIEPHLTQPDPAIPERDYQRLSSKPWFLILKAHKR